MPGVVAVEISETEFGDDQLRMTFRSGPVVTQVADQSAPRCDNTRVLE